MINKYNGWSLNQRDPQFIEQLMPFFEWFYKYYFRVTTEGWEQIPTDKQVMLVGSHNGGLASPDTTMMFYDWVGHFGSERPLYGLMHPYVWNADPRLAAMVVKAGAVRAHPKMAIAALEQGSNVLVYPGGAVDVFRPHYQREKIEFNNNKAFVKLALRYNVPIIPLISVGSHDTLFVIENVYPLVKQLHEWGVFPWLYDLDPVVFPIYLGLPWIISIGPLPNIPLPIQIHTKVGQPITFERYGRDAASDRTYVTDCYNQVVQQMQQALTALYRLRSWGVGSRE
ncbi:MAG: glycerol acyltransferase [Microcystaceae cyanobacterium]